MYSEADGYHEVAVGLADREANRAMEVDSPFYLGSITKTYTAAAVLRLVDQGRLRLDETLEQHFPALPKASTTTIRHLLTHTSGLKDFYSHLYYRPNFDDMVEMVTRRWTEAELIELSGRFGHWFEPGTDWAYSSTNYFLLGVITRRATDLTLGEAYQQLLYQPLGLHRTWLPKVEQELAPLPTGYMGPVKGWKHSERFGELGDTAVLDHSSAELAAGGLAAPAEEAVRFLRGLVGGELLAPATLATMREFRTTEPLGDFSGEAGNTTPEGYSMGLAQMQRAGITLLGHGGLYNGHSAGLWHLPDCDVTFALYFNRGLLSLRPILDELVPALSQNPDGTTRCRPRS